MFERVLFPTDFSSYANSVFLCLPELRTAGMRDVLLLSVVSSRQVPLGHTLNQDILEEVKWSCEQQLKIDRMALESQGLSARARLEEGSPPEVIARVAREEGVNLIVMGAQGRSMVQELLLGSITHQTLRLSPVPVLVYKFDVVRQLGRVACRRVCARLFRRVLHPTDFSETAQAAFNVVKRLKSAGTEEIILLHVQDARAMKHRPPEQLAEFDREDEARLEKMRKALALKGLPARIFVRHGIPFEETLKLAEEEDVCLIVLGLRGRSLATKMLVGSTFENVVRQSRQPVLVIRGER